VATALPSREGLARAVALAFGLQPISCPCHNHGGRRPRMGHRACRISRRVSRYIPACNLGQVGRHSGNAGPPAGRRWCSPGYPDAAG
jgi:hypothetical protein